MKPGSQMDQSAMERDEDAVVRPLFEDDPRTEPRAMRSPLGSVLLAALGGGCFLASGFAQYRAPWLSTPLQMAGSSTILLKAAFDSGLRVRLTRR